MSQLTNLQSTTNIIPQPLNRTQIPFQNPQMSFFDKVNATADSFLTFIKSKAPITTPNFQSNQPKTVLEQIDINAFETSKQNYIKENKCETFTKNQLNDITVLCYIKNPRQIEKGFFEMNYILYDIITEQFNWVVNRRYSDFIWLRNCLVAMFPGELIPQLPKKKLGNRRFEKDFVNKRQNSLQHFLNAILEKENFKSSEPLLIFLSCVDRTQFEQHMKLFTPKILTPTCIENIKSFTGMINTLGIDNDLNINKYFSNITLYSKQHEEILTNLHSNLKSYHDSMAIACSCLSEIEKNFNQLTSLSENSNVSSNFTHVYEQYGNFFRQWKDVTVKQTCVIKEIVNNYFKKVNKQYNSFNELLTQMDLLKKEYIDKNKALSIKKETLWIKKDFSKFELNPIEPVDNSKIYIDREYALSKMCYKESNDILKMEKLLEFFYYKISGEFANMIHIYDKEYSFTLKEFSEMIGKSLSESYMIWSHLESNINKDE